MFCIICGNSGHSKQYCPKYKATGESKTKGTHDTVQTNMYILKKDSLSKWALRDLIYPFDKKKDPI